MSPPSPQHRRRRSSILVGAGDLERLIAECDDALRADPKCLHTRAVRGHACMKAKRWAQAVQDFSEILGARPDDVHARFSRGMALFKSAHVDDAHRDFTRVLELNPAHVMARYARAGCYNSEGEYNQAIQEYWLALRHDEESTRAPLRVDGHHRIGWSSSSNAAVSASSAALTAAAASDADRCDARVTRSSMNSKAAATTIDVTSSSVSANDGAHAASSSQTFTRAEPRKAARKVVQVRVNLSQFALAAGPSVLATTAGEINRTGAESIADGATTTTKQIVDDHLHTDTHRPPEAFNASTRPIVAAQQPIAVDRGAMPQVRAAPRAVRRVTVVL